jgi:hypothetical protein
MAEDGGDIPVRMLAKIGKTRFATHFMAVTTVSPVAQNIQALVLDEQIKFKVRFIPLLSFEPYLHYSESVASGRFRKPGLSRAVDIYEGYVELRDNCRSVGTLTLVPRSDYSERIRCLCFLARHRAHSQQHLREKGKRNRD